MRPRPLKARLRARKAFHMYTYSSATSDGGHDVDRVLHAVHLDERDGLLHLRAVEQLLREGLVELREALRVEGGAGRVGRDPRRVDRGLRLQHDLVAGGQRRARAAAELLADGGEDAPVLGRVLQQRAQRRLVAVEDAGQRVRADRVEHVVGDADRVGGVRGPHIRERLLRGGRRPEVVLAGLRLGEEVVEVVADARGLQREGDLGGLLVRQLDAERLLERGKVLGRGGVHRHLLDRLLDELGVARRVGRHRVVQALHLEAEQRVRLRVGRRRDVGADGPLRADEAADLVLHVAEAHVGALGVARVETILRAGELYHPAGGVVVLEHLVGVAHLAAQVGHLGLRGAARDAQHRLLRVEQLVEREEAQAGRHVEHLLVLDLGQHRV
ncbi:hypothetical protein STCU_05608 [Strigomonas culicis]|uniref:Uncharacterized protein n=1 Tax=Strigomonas culicis TaxID=28005 RepID=S9UFN7_9TRYP|nr:hypothetical protein STCU_05608 [Strigomonas culicis]|eukprot:EPY27723.1 hypothetical protein STCU_05608 [Strigomonas culicis]